MAEQHKSQRSESALTPEIRIAYPHVHEKRTKRANGQPLKSPRHDATLLVPKLHNDPAQCPNYAMLAKHCMEAAAKAWGNFPQGGHWPIQDGDAPPKPKAPTVPGQAAAAPKEYPWRKGNWIVEVTHNLDPGPRVCVMQNGQAVEIPARVIAGKVMYKGGDYGFVSIHAYTFQNEKFGVNFGFEGVLFTREGEAIGSSGPRSASDMFGGVARVVAPAIAPTAGPPGVPGFYTPPPMPAATAPAPAPAPAMPVPPAAAPLPPMPVAPGPLPPFPTR